MSDDFKVYYCSNCGISVRVPLMVAPPLLCPACGSVKVEPLIPITNIVEEPGITVLREDPEPADFGAGNLAAPGDRLGRTVGEVKRDSRNRDPEPGPGHLPSPEVNMSDETLQQITSGLPNVASPHSPTDSAIALANLRLLQAAYPPPEPGGVTLEEICFVWKVSYSTAANRLRALRWRKVEAILPSGRHGFLYYPPRE